MFGHVFLEVPVKWETFPADIALVRLEVCVKNPMSFQVTGAAEVLVTAVTRPAHSFVCLEWSYGICVEKKEG